MPKEMEFLKISAEQLFEKAITRRAIPLCLSADTGLFGGIPLGGTVLIGSPPKSGKTTTVLQWAANAQNLFGSKVFYYNLEFRLTELVLSQVKGLKRGIDDFEIIMPPPITEKGENIGWKKISGEQWFDHIGKTLSDNHKAIVIVDSLAALSTEKEQSEDLGSFNMGKMQQLHAQFCRKYADCITPNQNTLFFITQIMANPGYGAPMKIKASNSIWHQADVALVGKRVEKWPEEDGKIKGQNVEFEVQASSFGPPNMKISIPIEYGKGVDSVKDMLTHCINWNIIQKKGSWFVLPFIEKDSKFVYTSIDMINNNEKLEPVKIQGEAELKNWANAHLEETEILNKEIRKLILG